MFLLVCLLARYSCEKTAAQARMEDGLVEDPVYLNGNQVIFIKQGVLANQIGFVHVKMMFSLGDVNKTVSSALESLDKIILTENEFIVGQDINANGTARQVDQAKMNTVIGGSYLSAILNIRERIKGFYSAFTDILVGLPNSKEETIVSLTLTHRRQRFAGNERNDTAVEREKRAAALAVGTALALGGSIMAFLSLGQIQDLYKKFGNLQRDHNRLVDVTEAHGNALKGISLDLIVLKDILAQLSIRNGVIANAMSDRLIDYISQVQNRLQGAIESAQQQRLSSRAINGKTLISLWKHLNTIADREGFDLMLNHAMDLYQMEASFIYDYERMEFILFVHVPMIPKGNKLSLHQFVPFPMHHDEKANLTMTPDVGEFTYLAINNDREYRILSSTDINACEKKGTFYLCAGRNVLYNDLSDTCLGGFYERSEEGIRNNCNFKFEKPKPLVVSSGFRQWLIYTPKQVSARVKCRKIEGSLPPIVIQEQTKLTLRQGCEMKFGRVHISADENIDEELKIHHTNWPESKDFFKSLLMEEQRKRVAGLDFGMKEFDAPSLQDLKNHDSFFGISIFNILLMSTIAFFVCLVIIIGIIFCLKFRKESVLRGGWAMPRLEKEERIEDNASAPEYLELVPVKVEEVKEEPICFAPVRKAPSAPTTFEKPEDTLRRRKVGPLKKAKMTNVTPAVLVCKTEEGREQERLYPELSETPKTKCLLSKAIVDKYANHRFLCTFHDNKEGCTGVFLSQDPVNLKAEDVLNDEIHC